MLDEEFEQDGVRYPFDLLAEHRRVVRGTIFNPFLIRRGRGGSLFRGKKETSLVSAPVLGDPAVMLHSKRWEYWVILLTGRYLGDFADHLDLIAALF